MRYIHVHSSFCFSYETARSYFGSFFYDFWITLIAYSNLTRNMDNLIYDPHLYTLNEKNKRIIWFYLIWLVLVFLRKNLRNNSSFVNN